jgi:hypothetical protein
MHDAHVSVDLLMTVALLVMLVSASQMLNTRLQGHGQVHIFNTCYIPSTMYMAKIIAHAR